MSAAPPARRVVATGPECTGKTTLVRRLAERFGTRATSEYARLYAESCPWPLQAIDVEPIARGQIALEEAAEASREGLIFLDTDLVSTVVYARHYYGCCPEWIERAAAERRGALYLLHLPDVAWVAEPGQREAVDRRGEQLALFRELLARFGAATIELAGDWKAREQTAVAAVERLLVQPR